MANWLEEAFGLVKEAESAALLTPRQAPEIKSFSCVVRQPNGAPGDFGETVDCYYIVTNGVLWLCDEKGQGGEKGHVLADGEEPRRIASRLRLEAWRREPGRSTFNRPLYYRPVGVA